MEAATTPNDTKLNSRYTPRSDNSTIAVIEMPLREVGDSFSQRARSLLLFFCGERQSVFSVGSTTFSRVAAVSSRISLAQSSFFIAFPLSLF